jgi:hypothetical protein
MKSPLLCSHNICHFVGAQYNYDGKKPGEEEADQLEGQVTVQLSYVRHK